MTRALLDARAVRARLDDFLVRLGRFERMIATPGDVGPDKVQAFMATCEEVEAFLLGLSPEERSGLDPDMVLRLGRGLAAAQRALAARMRMIAVVKDAVRSALADRAKPHAYGANGRLRTGRVGMIGETVA